MKKKGKRRRPVQSKFESSVWEFAKGNERFPMVAGSSHFLEPVVDFLSENCTGFVVSVDDEFGDFMITRGEEFKTFVRG